MAKNLDKELAEAAGLDDDDGMSLPHPPEVMDLDGVDDSGGAKKTNVALLGMLLLMVGGIVALFMFGFKEAAVYSMPVEQFLAQKVDHVDRRVRIEGELVKGTLTKRDKPCEYRFTIMGATPESRKARLDVRYAQCVVPDTFRDREGTQVTVEGMIAQSGHFDADLIMAKCASKYDPKEHALDPKKQAANTP